MYIIIQVDSYDDWKTYNIRYTSLESKAKNVCSKINSNINELYNKYISNSRWVELRKGDNKYTSGFNADVQKLTDMINELLDMTYKFSDVEYFVEYGVSFDYSKLKPL